MGLKEAIGKAKEKLKSITGKQKQEVRDVLKQPDEMTEYMMENRQQAYIGIDLAADEDMTAYIRQDEATEGAGSEKETKTENSTPEAEKGQEGAKTEATDSIEKLLGGIDEEMREEMQKKLDEAAQKMGIATEELAERLRQAAETIAKAFKELCDKMTATAPELSRIWKQYYECMSGLDEWQKMKIEMPNNERRRKKIPMVRRQAYLKNLKNQRKKKKK